MAVIIAYRTQHPKPKLAGSHSNNANIDPVKKPDSQNLNMRKKDQQLLHQV